MKSILWNLHERYSYASVFFFQQYSIKMYIRHRYLLNLSKQHVHKKETYIVTTMITTQRIVFLAIEQPIEELSHIPSG